MRYFFYTNNTVEHTVIIVDESSDVVKLFPPERVNHCSTRKSDWIDYYNGLNRNGRETIMYEFCETQFKKFAEKGITPVNHDGYFVAQRMIKAKIIA